MLFSKRWFEWLVNHYLGPFMTWYCQYMKISSGYYYHHDQKTCCNLKHGDSATALTWSFMVDITLSSFASTFSRTSRASSRNLWVNPPSWPGSQWRTSLSISQFVGGSGRATKHNTLLINRKRPPTWSPDIAALVRLWPRPVQSGWNLRP